MDENDDGARTGLWVVLGIITLLLFGLIGGLALRATHAKQAAAAKPVAAATAGDAELDAPLSGEIVGKLYFESGKADLPGDVSASLASALAALSAAPGKKLVLAGFHDTTGGAALNAELAKQRAKAVRAALTAAGAEASRVLLRKPEQTAGDGPAEEARRVEVRLVD